MNEELSVDDLTQLLDAASDFTDEPGLPNDAAAKDFLDRFPLPLIINCLQTKANVPGLENTLTACLESIFRTKYGASLIPHYMVTFLLENSSEEASYAIQLIIDYDIYSLLLDCLINGYDLHSGYLATGAGCFYAIYG